MGDNNVDGDGGEVDGDDGGVDGVDGDGSGALPRLGKVLEQRLLSLEIGLRRRRRCGTLLGETPIDLGFSHQRLLIGGRAMSEVDQGAHTIRWHGLGWHATLWCGHALALRQLSFGLRLVLGKIGGSGFVSSYSENISYVTFLKHKNSRKQGTGTMESR
jgi:hypothetical protein